MFCSMKSKLSVSPCNLCPRECGALRTSGQIGFCAAPAQLTAARAALHMWEEPCISGERGSGTVFFSGCNLRCVYCQNHEIAHMEIGKEITIEHLAKIFLSLQEKGAHNINLVTPSHYVLAIIEALELAKKQGLILPIVYNCSGYEKVEAIQALQGLVNIYLVDFKYMDSQLAAKYSHAPDYPEVAKAALAQMATQTGEARFDEQQMMQKGVIARHLLLPGAVANAKQVISYVYETYKDTVYLSLMNQYTPMEYIKQKEELTEINRKVTKREYDTIVNYAIELGVENGFIQEGKTAQESFIPLFDYEGIE